MKPRPTQPPKNSAGTGRRRGFLSLAIPWPPVERR